MTPQVSRFRPVSQTLLLLSLRGNQAETGLVQT